MRWVSLGKINKCLIASRQLKLLIKRREDNVVDDIKPRITDISAVGVAQIQLKYCS